MPVTQINQTQCCQPLKNASANVSAQPIREAVSFKNAPSNIAPQNTAQDSFQCLEAKYDFACRVAAYYKAEYENLCKNGACIA